MAQDFYPFVENGADSHAAGTGDSATCEVRHPARIAVYDDAAAAPRVVVIEPKDVRPYLEEITLQVTQLSQEQGGTIPFMVIREIVENFIHAYFLEPTISILNHGNIIRFSDQGPGIGDKTRALQYGTTSATEQMRRYIRGVGSGLPYVQQYMLDKGGSLEIDDNISGGTVVTLTARDATEEIEVEEPQVNTPLTTDVPDMATQGWPAQTQPFGSYQNMGAYPQQTMPASPQPGWQQTGYQQPYAAPTYPPQAYPQQGYPPQGYPQQPYAQQPYAQIPAQQVPAASSAAPWPTLSARARAIIDYLAMHDAVGPSDLSRTYGESQPTWTRELQALEEQGIVRKEGQKRRLTAYGRTFVS